MLELKNVSQKYGERTIFDNFSIKIEKGTFTALMGPSGCGKSTILRYFTKLQTPTTGEVITLDTIPLVFQERSCLEHLSVLDNVALPLVLKGVKDAKEQALEMLKVVGLEDQKDKYAKYPNLSGGQLQRVAIARSLVANPEVLLLDEPFSSLDSTTRRDLQDFLKQLHDKGVASTFIIVTHEAREAIYLADNILIMGANPGHVKYNVESNTSDRNSPRAFELLNYIESII